MQEDESHRGAEADKATPIPHVGRKRNDAIHMKILVPSGAVGAIIGKGGESIAEVQWVTGARIKLSKPNDFYPGTMERVCLIQGTLEGITRMHNYIMDRMLEKPECAGPSGTPAMLSGAGATGSGAPRFGGPSTLIPPGAADQPSGGSSVPVDTSAVSTWPMMPGSRLPWGRHQQVKILVPNCTAGLVIGKVGSYVKEIKDRTGAFIQVSQKSKEINLLERCITIAGEPDQCRAAVALVLAKIAEDPQSTSCPTISYSRVQGPVASAYPTGSPFAFTSLPRFPTATVTQAPHASDMTQATAPYGTTAEAYMSPAFQAALLQAAALALSQRSYYQQHQLPPAGFATAAPQVPAAPSQQAPQVAPSSAPRIGECGVPSGAGAPGEMSLYTPIAQSLPAQFVPPGATGLWPAYEGGWGTGAEHAVPGLTAPPTAAGTASFEHAYPTHLNLTYYPTNQPLLAHVPSRHPGEAYPVGSEVFSPPTFGPSVPIPFTSPANLRVTSPVCGATPLTAFYPGLYSHPAAEPSGGSGGAASGGGGSTGGTAGKVPSSTVPLSDLFATLRLSGVNYPEMTGPELGQLFSTLSQHPGLVGLGGGYQMLSSPTMPGPVFTSLSFASGVTTQSSSGPITGHSQHGTASFDPIASASYTSVPSADSPYSGRPPGGVPITCGSCIPTGEYPVPVIAKRPDRSAPMEGSRHLLSKSTDDESRSSTVRSRRKKSSSPHQSPPRLSSHFDSSSSCVTAAPSIPVSLASPVLLSPSISSGPPPLLDTDQPTSESPEFTSQSQSDPVSADVSSSHSSCSPDNKPTRSREVCHRGGCHTRFKPSLDEVRSKSEQSSSAKPRFNGQIAETTTTANGLAK